MPTYFEGSLSALVSGAGLTNPYALSTGGSAAATPSANCCCPSSTKFLETLTDKLIEMTNSLKQQFKELEDKQGPVATKGILLVNVEVSAQVSYRMEYVIYVQRYGPPMNGIFDPVYLDLIRAELAAGVI